MTDDLPKKRVRRKGKEDRPREKSRYSSQSRYSDDFLREQLTKLRCARNECELPGPPEGMENAQRLDKHIAEINEELELRQKERELSDERDTLFHAQNMRFPPRIVLHIGQHGAPSALVVVDHNFTLSPRNRPICHYKVREIRRYPPDVSDDDIIHNVQRLTAELNRRRHPDADKHECLLYIEFSSRGQDFVNRYLDASLRPSDPGALSINVTAEGDKAQVSLPIPVVIVGRATVSSQPLKTQRNTTVRQVAEADIISALRSALANKVVHLKSIPRSLVELLEKQLTAFTQGTRKISQEERILQLEPGGELIYALALAIYQIYQDEYADANSLSPETQQKKARSRSRRELELKIFDDSARHFKGWTKSIRKAEYVSTPNSRSREGGQDDDDDGGFSGPRNL